LCYFGELGEAMGAARAALRPGGLIVFTVEARQGGEGEAFHLQPNGRYTHRRDYVSAVLADAGLTALVLREETLRMEGGRPVVGWLVAARHGAQAAPEE
jgi:predicted TPR repeat methyltransferase